MYANEYLKLFIELADPESLRLLERKLSSMGKGWKGLNTLRVDQLSVFIAKRLLESAPNPQ